MTATSAIDDSKLDGLSAKEQAALIRPFLEEARARVAAQHEAGAPGDETTAAWATACDAAVIALFRAARRAHPAAGAVSLVAAGGYGRAELCPYSDLDLWFVLPKGGRVDADSRALAEAVLYPLWDLKLEVGHAVRSPEETLGLARDDLSAATALLDLRFLDGERAPLEALLADVPRAIGDINGFIARLKQEKEDRHARFGDTVFLLEPNVKNGEGGYRDLLVGLWAVRARYRVKRFSDLPGIGALTHRPVEALAAAHRFLLEVRTAAHLAAKRKADRLTFELQESIAPAWVGRAATRPQRPAVGALASVPPPPDMHIEPAVAPAVEALMQEYFIHAKAVRRETDRLLERCRVEPARKPSIRRLDDSFALFNGKLSTHGPDVFRERPSEMVRLFNVALETGAEIYGHTRDLVADTVASMGTRLAEDPKAGEELMRLILDDRDQGAPSLLEQAHDLGLMAAVMPEFAPCTGRVQHDLYHVFTVDQHQLYAVGRLKELARGELAEELQTASAAMKDVRRRAPLYLGTLLHDVGKPLGKGHSETGARLAVTIAKRLGLSEEDAAQTEFLVRKHLVLSHLSQRRDLNDVAMIANLADELKDDETLRELYLLTIADMSMVAPGNLTAWKEQLLTELYTRTMSHLAPSPAEAAASGESEAELIARRKARVGELMGESEPMLAPWFSTVPDRYIVLTAPKQIARHIALTRRRRGPVATEVVHRARRGSSELTVVADDAPGLLAKIAGVLVAHRVDVLSATITSRRLPGDASTAPRTEAVDVFVTRDRYGRPITDEKRWAKVEEDLARVLSGKVPVERVIEERRERGGLPERVVPAVATEIEVDNNVSAEFSVVDVFTQDRPGVLYAITKTLAALQLDIHLSKVATEAARVADVFYVREAAGGGKLSETRIAEVKQALTRALAAVR